MNKAFQKAESNEIPTHRDTSSKRSSPDNQKVKRDELPKPVTRKRAKLNESLQDGKGITAGNPDNGAGDQSTRQSNIVGLNIDHQTGGSLQDLSSDHHPESGDSRSALRRFLDSSPFGSRKTRSKTQKQAANGQRFVTIETDH